MEKLCIGGKLPPGREKCKRSGLRPDAVKTNDIAVARGKPLAHPGAPEKKERKRAAKPPARSKISLGLSNEEQAQRQAQRPGFGQKGRELESAGLAVAFDKGLRSRGADRIAVTAQSQYTGGSPMSQREYAGFNWPVFAVASMPPVTVGPEAASCAALERGPSHASTICVVSDFWLPFIPRSRF